MGAHHTWTEISGHTCGKYEEQAQRNADSSRRLLERFLHFFTRYKAQADSAKAEIKLQTEVPKKILALWADTKHSYANSELQWLEKAVTQLQEARRVLGNSYPFAFYVFGEQDFPVVPTQPLNSKKLNVNEIVEQGSEKLPEVQVVPKPVAHQAKKGAKGKANARAAKEEKKPMPVKEEKKEEEQSNNPIISQKTSLASLKNIFNDHQEQLEFTTERLSALLATKLNKIDETHLKDVMNYTVLADRRCRGLFDVIQNEILQDGSQIPNYKPLIPQAEMSGYLITLTSLPTENYSTKSSTTTTTSFSSSSSKKGKEPKIIGKLSNKPEPQKEKEKDKDVKRKIWDPTSKDYDEDAALQEALKLSQSPSFPPPQKKPFEGEEQKIDDDYKKAIDNSLMVDEDTELNMALQISLTDK
eukprot:TRINITY_DN1926_c0_g1_i12.p1 TRINITY_DN1926_c0_g1~~TRINITY_DN1926_c0_g1_i12.p1  ORF type:complete len:414 (+),score=112.21 TRINITY_DN1926_c0_g1_i12:2880-4121(+)